MGDSVGSATSCPLFDGIEMFGGKWKPRIICALNRRGILRYAELKKELSSVSDTCLSEALNELVEDGLIRKINRVNEKSMEYELNEKGRDSVPILFSICEWSYRYNPSEYTGIMPMCAECKYIASKTGISASH